MKDYVVLEVNGKKDVLGEYTVPTPNEFLLINDTTPILNNRLFEEFVDAVFWLTMNEITHDVGKKIRNVYITFLNDDEELICSIVIDRFRPRRGKYRMRLLDWQAKGLRLKYFADDEE